MQVDQVQERLWCCRGSNRRWGIWWSFEDSCVHWSHGVSSHSVYHRMGSVFVTVLLCHSSDFGCLYLPLHCDVASCPSIPSPFIPVRNHSHCGSSCSGDHTERQKGAKSPNIILCEATCIVVQSTCAERLMLHCGKGCSCEAQMYSSSTSVEALLQCFRYTALCTDRCGVK
jgi:hypothetical protein